MRPPVQPLKQRAEYTHKFNSASGRHGWLRLTPAYSLKIVEEILEESVNVSRVLDPFCGTGTTALSAICQGADAVTTDINPFLVWLTNVKTRQYSSEDVTCARKAAEDALGLVKQRKYCADPPPLHKIERWWGSKSLEFLCHLRASIDVASVNEVYDDLLKLAFCRTLIKLSNAAFNHQSMSFKATELSFDMEFDFSGIFKSDCEHIFNGALEPIRGRSQVLLCDARELCEEEVGTFDLVITSPPYANRMSYIRELRPYMYWLGYLVDAREAGELDWQAIGGTWGVATSRLNDWRPSNGYEHSHLSDVSRAIRAESNKNGELLGAYVEKYFDDMCRHFSALRGVMRPGAKIHYIIGNSTFYGTLVKTEELYADMARMNGFGEVEIRPIRKRNSKKELVEYCVSARAEA